MVGALFVQQIHQQRQRFFLNIAAPFEIDAKAVELILAITGPEPKGESALAEYVDKCRVLGDTYRVGEGQGDDRGADLDAPGQRSEIGRIDKHVRHDAVFVAEM